MTDDDQPQMPSESRRCCPCRRHACCAAAQQAAVAAIFVPGTPAWWGGQPGKTRLVGYRLCGACMALPVQERTLKVEGALAAPLVGRNHAAMDTRSRGMLPCLGVRSGGTPTDRARDRPPCLEGILDRLWPFFAVALEAKGGCDPRNMQRKGQPLGRAGMVIASYLSHPRASDVSDVGRSGIMPVQRREAVSKLDHRAYILPAPATP